MEAATPALLKPKRLAPGQTIGLVTPSTYVSDPDELRTAVRTIEHFGCKVKLGQFVKRKLGYLGGTIEERAADVNAMFADPGVDAVFAIRDPGFGGVAPDASLAGAAKARPDGH